MKRSWILAGPILLLGGVAGALHTLPVGAAPQASWPATAGGAVFPCLPQAWPGAHKTPDGRWQPSLRPAMPADSVLASQPEVNCFAWQQFIALNWKADRDRRGKPDTSVPPSAFGLPEEGPVVWETYKDTFQIFQPGGATPAAWNAEPEVPAACDELVRDGARSTKLLRQAAKVRSHSGHQQLHDEIDEAGVAPPAWLTAQNGNLVHYEVLVNEDYFNYVVDDANRFYDSRRQAEAVQPGGPGIRFPVGPSSYGPTGAMEFKAGWLEIDPSLSPFFLTSEAWIIDDDTCRPALVGLVGLHIVHKTQSMPNWTWATFEHVANAPDRLQDEARGSRDPLDDEVISDWPGFVTESERRPERYIFYSDRCPSGSVCRPSADGTYDDSACPPECQQNRKPQVECVGPNEPAGCDPRRRPIQVVREVPIPPDVRALNQAARTLIAVNNPDSVFRYYRLVNAQWPQSGEEVQVGETIPLQEGGPAPTTGLSNVTSETYAQRKTCLTCHRTAPIACSTVSGPSPNFASDYTFQLSRASEPHRPAYCGAQDDD